MTTITKGSILASLLLLTACGSLPEGQPAYGTTAVTRWLDPEMYQQLLDEDDDHKKGVFALKYRDGTTGQAINKQTISLQVQ